MSASADRAPTLVTGAAGWLGKALVNALATGAGDGGQDRRLRGLIHNPADAAALRSLAPSIEIVVGDIKDPAAVDAMFEGAEGATVFHAAGVIHPRVVRDFFDVNVGGTELVLDRSRRVDARRVVHVSSNSPFGFNDSPSGVFDEASPYHPYRGYGRSKMEAELLVKQSQARGDVETVIVRCPWFYGPYQPARQTRLFSLVKQGRFPLFGDGLNRRSMAYVDDLAQGMILAAGSPGAAGKSYWIADEKAYTMREILESIRRALAAEHILVSPRQPRLPRAVASLAGAADALLQGSGRYSQEIHVLSEMSQTIACTIDKARSELGYQPSVGLDEGMHRSLRWAIENGAAV